MREGTVTRVDPRDLLDTIAARAENPTPTLLVLASADPGCRPCVEMTRSVDALAATLEGIDVVYASAEPWRDLFDRAPGLATALNVRGLPHLEMLVGNVSVGSRVGNALTAESVEALLADRDAFADRARTDGATIVPARESGPRESGR